MNELFKVKKRLGGDIVGVFDVKSDNGIIEFLVYDFKIKIWTYVSAIYFEPVKEY